MSVWQPHGAALVPPLMLLHPDDTRSCVSRLVAEDIVCLPLPRGSKQATVKGWEQEDRRWSVADFAPNDNVGIRLDRLVDIDCDCDEARHAARLLLPETPAQFGRSTHEHPGHYLFRVIDATTPRQFRDPSGAMLIELRTGHGEYTVAPPSHLAADEKSGKPASDVRWHGSYASPSHLSGEAAEKAAALVATAALVARHWPREGGRHEAAGLLAGFLAHAKLEAPDIEVVVRASAIVAGDNEVANRVQYARDTVLAHAAGKPVGGGPKLAKLLGGDVVALLREWHDRSPFRKDRGRVVANDQDNIRLALTKLDIDLVFDGFAQKILIRQNGSRWQSFEDQAAIPIWLAIDKQFGFLPSREFFDAVVKDLAWSREQHPVKAYLTTLTWDGEPRLDRWLTTYGGAADSPYVRSVGRLPLMAAVRRVRNPGAKFDELLVLEGEQGTLKSSALQELCPDERWFSDDLPLGADSKQIIERTAGKWLIEASELQGYKGSDAERLKSFLSRRTDGPVRMAYARLPTEVPRQFVIVGTTNSLTSYLKDSTGARRFWPVQIRRFDVAALRRDRDQLWAEAAAREAAGESIRLDVSLHSHAAKEQEQRRQMDPWEELIGVSDVAQKGRKCVPAQDVWDVLGVAANSRDNRHAARVAEVMQRLGFDRKERRWIRVQDFDDGGRWKKKQTWCWLRGDVQKELFGEDVPDIDEPPPWIPREPSEP